MAAYPVEDIDSGMSSQNSKADTPEKNDLAEKPYPVEGRSVHQDSPRPDRQVAIPGPVDQEEDDEEDETLGERLWGLTEMFPETVRNVVYAIGSGIGSTITGTYGFSRQAAWILSTSSLLLFAPVMFEVERANTQEALRRDQQQILLGPNAAGGPPTR